MKINKDKTELITLSKERDDVEITIEGVRVRLVKNFKYLGVNINEKCDMGIEITKSIESYTNNFRLLNPLLKKKKYSHQGKSYYLQNDSKASVHL